MASSADLAEVITAGVASLANLTGDVTTSLADIAEVAPSADYDGDVTAGVTSMEYCGKRVVVRINYVDNYDDYRYDCQYDDCPDYYELDDWHSYDSEYDDYHDHYEYGDYGGSDYGTYDTEEYQKRDVILSDVIPPRTDLDMLSVERVRSAERVPADLRPSLPCAIPATDCPPAPLQDTADCSAAMEACGTVPSDCVGDNDVYHYDSRHSA